MPNRLRRPAAANGRLALMLPGFGYTLDMPLFSYLENLYLDRAPFTHSEFRKEVIEKQIDLMIERDVWKRPDRG